ncbi:MAG: TMEM43 family protein [Firmicutes bacterium]|nr:TMEM43 family protein [Bacillota bacterium]
MAKESNENIVKTTKKTVVTEKTVAKKPASKKADDVTIDKVVSKKHFQTPTETWWGKLIVWIIMFGMVGLIILSFILAILKGTA